MENASKALIIAGAILLAILIIGLGIFIYNQASNSVGDTRMDQVAIKQFNGKFEIYLDKELSSIEAKSLIDTINYQVVDKNDFLSGITSKKEIKTGNVYSAKATYSKSGIITNIEITDMDAEPPQKEHNITISTEEFNDRFATYIGDAIYPGPFEGLKQTIGYANRDFGDNTVTLVFDGIPANKAKYCVVYVTKYYSDGKIKEISYHWN